MGATTNLTHLSALDFGVFLLLAAAVPHISQVAEGDGRALTLNG